MKREISQSMPKAWSATSQTVGKAGFSIVEVILSGALLILMVTTFIGAYLYGEESTALAGKSARATMLAEEGLEAVRNIRDSAYANLTDGTHGLTTTSNQWNLSGSSDITDDITDIFTRQVIIATVNSNTKSITSTVTWIQNAQRSGSVTLSSYLTNWTAAAPVLPGTRIAYYDVTNGDLKYAECNATCTTAGNWTKVTVDSTGDVGDSASLAMDGSKVRIAYRDTTNGDLKYAECDTTCTTAGNWTKVTVDSTLTAGRYASMVLDSGKPRIAYIEGTNDDLRYAECNGACTTAGNWTKVTVESTNSVGSYNSLALDGTKLRLAYREFTSNDVKYAECDSNCTTAGNWTKVVVESTNTVGEYNSLVLDSGKPRITYYDATNDDLHYAECNGTCTTAGNWTKIAVDTTNTVGTYGSLNLDGTKLRAAYRYVTSGDLKYAECDANCTTAGNWTKVAIDTTNDVGRYTSLAIDTSKPRIAYYDVTNGDLRYASCDATCTTAGNWTKVTVDSTGNVGQFASINH